MYGCGVGGVYARARIKFLLERVMDNILELLSVAIIYVEDGAPYTAIARIEEAIELIKRKQND